MAKKPETTPQQPWIKRLPILIFSIGFVLYSNTFQHDYALDDKIVITSNQITKKGLAGLFDHFFYDSMDGFWANNYGVDVSELNKAALVSGGRYRPLTMVTHSLEYAFFGTNPSISHVVNAALFGGTAVVLFLVLLKLFPFERRKWYWNIPVLATFVFLVHPIHTEVVANIKGRDELLSVFLALLAVHILLKSDAQSGKAHIRSAVLGGGVFFLSLLSKETTLPFVGLFPLLIYYFQQKPAKASMLKAMPMLAATVGYLAIRFMVLDASPADQSRELMNNNFVLAEGGEKWATVLLTLGAYVKLLFFPHPLTHDYYPFHLPFTPADQQYAQWTDIPVLLSGLVILGLVYLVLAGFQKRTMESFAILWFVGGILLVANILFPIGAFMNERFLYLPSIGFAILVAHWLMKLTKKEQTPMTAGFLIVVFMGLGFTYKTIERNAVWENDETLSLTDVQISEGSAKVKMSAALQLINTAQQMQSGSAKLSLLNQAIGHLGESISIYPSYIYAHALLGLAYLEAEDYNASYTYYQNVLRINPDFDGKIALRALRTMVLRLIEAGETDLALRMLATMEQYQPNQAFVYASKGEIYGRYLNNYQESERFLQKALSLDPNNADYLQKLGVAFAVQGKLGEAINYLEESLKVNPSNTSVMKNLAAAYYQIGNTARAQELMSQASGSTQGNN